ncbi:MAG: tyrosine-protein phosphatase, partial [Chloroflexota bacterium]|nr:tyrosine-protein phosphatase [Chloroflexota bacterium]
SSLGIKTICDLRTAQEKNHRPDRVPANSGIRLVHIPISGSMQDEAESLSHLFPWLSGKARKTDYAEIAQRTYTEYVTDFRVEFAEVLKLFTDANNLPILIHCTAGKDRTGFSCALIQLTLGMSQELVIQDYFQTNDHLQRLKADAVHRLRLPVKLGFPAEKILPLIEARKEYIEAAIAQINKDYQAVDNYVRRGLGLSDEDARKLNELLLEKP